MIIIKVMYIKKDWKCCDKYDGSVTMVEMPEGWKHHSKSVCAFCGHFIKWGKNPKNVALMELNHKKASEILKHEGTLQPYELAFSNDMLKRTKTSPRQQKFLDELYDKVVVNNFLGK